MLTQADHVRISKAVLIFSTPMAFIGIFSNALTISVFRRMPTTVTTTYFLLASFIDVGYLCATLFVVLLAFGIGYDSAQLCSYLFHSCFFYVSLYFAASLRRVAHCITMLISLDRCFLIAFPFRARALQHIRRPRLYAGICFVLVFIMRIPWIFFFRVFHLPKAPPGCQVPDGDVGYFAPTAFYLETRENGWGTLFRYAFTVLFTYIPVITMGFSTIYMISKLARHTKGPPTDRTRHQEALASGQNSSDSDRQIPSKDRCERPQTESTSQSAQSQFFKLQRQNSITVLVYTGFYLVLALPDAMQTLLATFMPGYEPGGKEHFFVLTIAIIYNLLDVISCTMNFFVYVSTGRAFRAQVMALVFREAKHDRSGDKSSVTTVSNVMD